jgi:uridine kinase
MNKNKPVLIGIAGGSGSGKTTFLQHALNSLGSSNVAVVSQDNYYHHITNQREDENGMVNFDLPTSIDREHFYADLSLLLSGNKIVKHEYTFNNPDASSKEIVIAPASIVIVEGLFVFHYQEIYDLCDIKVYIDADLDVRLHRRINRDGKERGYAEDVVLYQWNNHVRPAELLYLEPYRESCEIIVDNTHSFENGMSTLIEMIREHQTKTSV